MSFLCGKTACSRAGWRRLRRGPQGCDRTASPHPKDLPRGDGQRLQHLCQPGPPNRCKPARFWGAHTPNQTAVPAPESQPARREAWVGPCCRRRRRGGSFELIIICYYGAPTRSRTPHLVIRSHTLYPIELWALFMLFLMMLIRHSLWCGREDSNLHRIAPTSPSSWRVYHSATTAYSLFMAHHNEINGAGEENRTLTVSLEG